MIKLSDIKSGDIIVTKKKHPCGFDNWLVVSTGVEFKLQCLGCNHTVILSSENIKKITKALKSQQ